LFVLDILKVRDGFLTVLPQNGIEQSNETVFRFLLAKRRPNTKSFFGFNRSIANASTPVGSLAPKQPRLIGAFASA